MIKNFFKILTVILILFLLFIGYFAYFGFTTTKFNTIIKDEIKKQNKDLDIELKKVKLHLDLKNITIKIKTKNPKILLNNSQNIEIKQISSNILIKSYFQKKFAIKNLLINSKSNDLKSYIDFFRLTNNSIQLILLNQFVKSGKGEINIDLNFDEFGKIKKNYYLSGKISNTILQIPNKDNIKELNFSFSIKNNDYNLEKILFKFNKINFFSESLNIKNKNGKFFVKGNIKNKKNKINNDLIFLIFNNSLEQFDFSNTNFDSTSEFTFDLSKKFKIKNLKVETKLNIDELILKHNSNQIKHYIKNYNNLINLKENKFHINYSKKEVLIDGSSEFYITEDFKDLIKYKIIKSKNKIDFETFLNLDNLDIAFKNFTYNKAKNQKASLKVKGFKNNNKLFFQQINYNENNNKIKINNLEINDNKILNLDKLILNYKNNNNYENKISLINKDGNYELLGESFDSTQLIENLSNSDSDDNLFEIFKNLNSKIKINLNEVKLDDTSVVNNFKGSLIIKKSKIFNINLNSNFSNSEKLFILAETKDDKSFITTFHSDRAKPFVKKYKFIKGFENGNLDFSSVKKDNISKSKLIIDNFKVQEIPVLAKILTLASLQGIADLLTGEGVRFTDFEMIYSNKGNLMTIDEIYAIGPALSIMMEGYVERNKLVSLRGTLVPATTINRSISSIPLLGDILVGKKVGEGVFGVSFKIKGPPGDLKTKVNPIKTLTPRFITRTLEKIKKN